MEKLASQIFEGIRDWVEENPNSVKNILASGSIGAGAGALLPIGANEDSRSRIKKRLANALIGAGLGLGVAGINATSNAATINDLAHKFNRSLQRTKKASSLDSLKEFATSDLAKGVLATGALGAGAGALLSGREKGETRKENILRRIRNGVLGASLAGGAYGLGASGIRNFSNALPANDVDPVTKFWRSPISRLSGASLIGTIASIAENKGQKNRAGQLLKEIGKSKAGGKEALQRILDDPLIKNKGGKVEFTKEVKDLFKLFNRGANLDVDYTNAGLNESANRFSKALTRAGVSAGRLPVELNRQGIPFGVGRRGIFANKHLQAGLGVLSRNKLLGAGALIGSVLPEITSGTTSLVSNLFPGSDVVANPEL